MASFLSGSNSSARTYADRARSRSPAAVQSSPRSSHEADAAVLSRSASFKQEHGPSQESGGALAPGLLALSVGHGCSLGTSS